MHTCYTCRHVVADGTARFPARFAGPPGTVNGGIAVGALACPALRVASEQVPHATLARINARISAAVPLERKLSAVVTEREGASLTWTTAFCDRGQSLVSGGSEIIANPDVPRPGEAIARAPAMRAPEIAAMARVGVPDRPPFFEETGEHPIRGCFSCGPDNADGLQIYPRVAADGVTCAPWRPAAEFDDGDGALSTMILASALDCSSGICMPVAMQRELLAEDRFFLLGSLALRMLRVPPVAREYRVVARALLRDGRKFFGLAALFDDAGTPYAMAESTWIVAPVTRTEAFGAW